MKTKNVLLSMAIAALFLAGCSKENDSPIEDGSSNYVSIKAGIGQFLTKSHNATTFNDGAVIGVYAWTGDAATITATEKKDYTYFGTAWTATTAMTWPDITTNHYFLGVYPTPDHLLSTNPSTAEGSTDGSFIADTYTLNTANDDNSDLLIATNTGGINGSTTDAVSLTFNHIMAKLTINLTFASEFTTSQTVSSVTVNAKAKATINYLTKAVTESSTETAADITMPAVTANTVYSSIMVPQNISDIIITISGETNKYKLADPDIDLTSGVNQILNLTVGKDGLVTLTSTGIADWTDATGTGTAVEVTGA